MEQQNQLQQIMSKLEENSRKQLKFSRIQCLFSVICAVCCVFLLLTVLRLLPQVEAMMIHAEAILTDLEVISGELAKLDLTQMVENINSLVKTSQTGVEEALGKINEIDFDALNQAVKDLSNVVKPMADFVKKLSFGGLL